MNRSKLGDGDLKIRKRLQQEGFERLVGAVQFVDQQHRRAFDLRAHRLQQGPLDQIVLGEQLVLQHVAIGTARRLGSANRDHLLGEVPFIDGTGRIQPLIALQPDQAPPQAGRNRLCDLGLADPRLALQKQRPSQFQRQEHHRAQRPPADIVLPGQHPLNGVDRGYVLRHGACSFVGHNGARVEQGVKGDLHLPRDPD